MHGCQSPWDGITLTWRVLLFVCLFVWAIHGGGWGLLLALHSKMTTGELGAPYGMLGTKLESTVCNASAILAVLLLQSYGIVFTYLLKTKLTLLKNLRFQMKFYISDSFEKIQETGTSKCFKAHLLSYSYSQTGAVFFLLPI